ncbi:hypothetical protein RB623_08080 [Mesorhizobium sp. LHD-90]|uniref:hypothetical protein n=1 Tax=Mesorhizobium sp. LHD-90 TaxID=3071414 RepID=UPI0027E00BFF|nr:hypothetical protein [Mesorhizobium sp. LHD-90]MDQ6434003.1 hypothetical protein [Mesorhizobium sp. LHD-90]
MNAAGRAVFAQLVPTMAQGPKNRRLAKPLQHALGTVAAQIFVAVDLVLAGRPHAWDDRFGPVSLHPHAVLLAIPALIRLIVQLPLAALDRWQGQAEPLLHQVVLHALLLAYLQGMASRRCAGNCREHNQGGGCDPGGETWHGERLSWNGRLRM